MQGRRQDRRGRHLGAAAGADFALARYNRNGSPRPELLRRRQADDRLRRRLRRAAVALQADGKIVAVGIASGTDGDFALARYNPDGSLDTSFSGDGKQTTDFGRPRRGDGVALQGDGKIVVVGSGGSAAAATSRSPATTPTARSTRASPATASRRPTSGASTRRPGWRSRATARSSRSARRGADGDDFALARYNPNGIARHELLRRRQADDRLRRLATGRTGWRSRATARSSRSARAGAGGLRARPLQPQRLARPELLRRRQADDRLRGLRRGDRGGAPGRTARSSRSAAHRTAPPRLRARPLQPERDARPELLRRRQADDRLRRALDDEASGVAIQGDGKIVAVGAGSARPATSRSPATTPTARSTRASPATASRRPTSGVGDAGERGGAPGRRQDRRGRRAAARRRRLRARPLQPQRIARHELLRRRQADDRLRGARQGDRGGAPGERQDRRGRAARAGSTAATSRSPATTPTARSTRASPATASRRPTSGASRAGRAGWRSRGRQDRRGRRGRDGSDFALARYNPNGSLDTSFSGDGKQTTDFGGLTTGRPGWRSRRRQDRRGRRRGADGDFALARYNPNGSLDTSFSGDGKQTTDFAGRRRGDGVALQATARSSRSAAGGGAGDFALARYNPNGSLDTSFSGDGKQTTDFGGLSTGQRGGAPGRRQDRRGRRAGGDFALARYNPNGSLDTSFSGDGKQTTDFGGAATGQTGWRSRATARSSRSAPAPPAATSRSPATTPTARSTRASPGTASGGPTSGRPTRRAGVALQADGRIIAVGRRLGPGGTSDFALARYLGG